MYMKNIVKAIAVLAGVAGLAACTKYADYTAVPFASLDFRSATVEESDPAGTFNLPVHLYNHDGACTVTYVVEAGSAKEGVDYTLVDASGVLTFPAGTDTQNISVSISGQPGVYTGNLKFNITLKSASDDVQIGSFKTCTVTVKDLDHPLANLFGDYTIKGVTVNDDNKLTVLNWTMSISPVEGSADKIKIGHITPFDVAYNIGELSVIATVSADKKTITIAYPQDTGTEASAFSLAENFIFYGHEGASGGYVDSEGVVTFKLGDDGVWKTTDCYGFSTPSDIVAYSLFYSYAAVFSNASPTVPTTFVKK